MDLSDNQFAVLGPKVEEPKGGQVAWAPGLETGIEVLDGQHRRYIDLLNNYLAKASAYADTEMQTEQILEAFKFLRRYAEEHFATEDAIMKEFDYPGYAAHHDEHQYFIEHVKNLARQMEEQGFSQQLAREVNFYAIEWFIDHILAADMLLVDFLKDFDLQEKANEIAP